MRVREVKLYARTQASALKLAFSNVWEHLVDAVRYIAHSGPPDRHYARSAEERHVEAQLTRDYHRVEKGLALANPRQPFGKDVGVRLRTLLAQAPSELLADHATTALAALEEWNAHGVRSALTSPVRADLPVANPPFSLLAKRRSVRDFDGDRIPDRSTLVSIAEAAGLAPSVCNRQPWRIRYFTNRDSVRRAMSFQNGNRGFGDEVPVVALITADLRLMSGPSERRQCLIDASLFAMSLAIAAEESDLATCMLNLSLTNRAARALRSGLGVEGYEEPIMLMAIGYQSPSARVARSPRRPVAQFVSFDDSAV